MITEWIMKRCGFNSIMVMRTLGIPRVRYSYCVGLLTGPDEDYLCVVDCLLWEDYCKYLSPPGHSVLQAAIKAWWKRKRVLKAGVVLGTIDPAEIDRIVASLRPSGDEDSRDDS